MDLGAVYKKTQKGLEEMAHRSVLGMRERTLLVMVDGKTTAADLLARARHMPDPQALLAKLIEGGFIEAESAAVLQASAVAAPAPAAAAPLPQEQRIIDETIRFADRFLDQVLGPDAEGLVVALAKSRTVAELRARIDKTREVIEGMGKKRRAEEFWTTAQALLEGKPAPAPERAAQPEPAPPPPPAAAAPPPPASASALSPAAPPSSIEEAVRFARRFLHDNLGPDADMLLEPIEKCKTAAELFARMEKTRESIIGFSGRRKAEEFWNGVLPRLPKV